MIQGSGNLDLILENNEDKVIILSSEDHDTAEPWKLRNPCGRCVVAAVILYAVNALAFGLFMMIGNMLGDLEDLGAIVDAAGIYIAREHLEMIIVLLAMAAILVANLGTLYFLCKRSDRSNRAIKAGWAVFGCHRRPKEYTEATLPVSDVLQRLWRESKPCDLSCAQLFRGVIAVLAALAAFMAFIVVGTGDPYPMVTQGGMLILLCIPALALWALVCRLASQVNFMVPETSECECVEIQGEEQIQESDDLA
jgi:hypothetical protein